MTVRDYITMLADGYILYRLSEMRKRMGIPTLGQCSLDSRSGQACVGRGTLLCLPLLICKTGVTLVTLVFMHRVEMKIKLVTTYQKIELGLSLGLSVRFLSAEIILIKCLSVFQGLQRDSISPGTFWVI